MASASPRKYWFHAKRYGWGWGLPSAWQGWVVLVAYVALVLGGIPLIHTSRSAPFYALHVVILTIGFVVICWLTGEPPRWRWGGRDR